MSLKSTFQWYTKYSSVYKDLQKLIFDFEKY